VELLFYDGGGFSYSYRVAISNSIIKPFQVDNVYTFGLAVSIRFLVETMAFSGGGLGHSHHSDFLIVLRAEPETAFVSICVEIT
jgi:hypothetical protein